MNNTLRSVLSQSVVAMPAPQPTMEPCLEVGLHHTFFSTILGILGTETLSSIVMRIVKLPPYRNEQMQYKQYTLNTQLFTCSSLVHMKKRILC